MKLIVKIVISLVMVGAVVLLIGYQQYRSEIDLGTETVTLIIAPGDGFSKVSNGLVISGVVASSSITKVAARLRGVDRKLVPGRYDFNRSNSVATVLDRLESGDFLRIKVTFPEGSTIWQVASIISHKMETDSAELVSLNHDSDFLDELGLPYLEGYIFPETYFFPWGSNNQEIIRIAVAQFKAMTESIWPDKMVNGISSREAIIMASIIESETGLKDERRMVSSVYHNRIRRNIRLDADPTVIYGLGGLERPLWFKDLRKDTPYNTYMHKGFPPTPINSPGLAAIKAAINPEISEFIFFVADNDGGHRFSKTNAEHERAKRDIKKERNGR